MTLYGYARVSVRESEDKNLDLQVERLVRAGCAMGNVRAEESTSLASPGPTAPSRMWNALPTWPTWPRSRATTST